MFSRSALRVPAFAVLTLLLMPACGTAPPESLACTMEARICPDGSAVGRNPALGCAFDPCPALRACGPQAPCPDKEECFDFPGDDQGPYCFSGDPCILCPSFLCDILETYPAQVVCR